MGFIINGMTLSHFRPLVPNFLFSDYMKLPNSMMEIPYIWTFTHDSIGVNEDESTRKHKATMIR